MLVNELAATGHNVTVLSSDFDPHPPKNVHFVLMENIYDHMFDPTIRRSIFQRPDCSQFTAVVEYNAFCVKACEG